MSKFEVGREMLAIQGEKGHWDSDEYMHGLYNGMEFMLSLVEGREPVFRDAPSRFKKYTSEEGPTAEISERSKELRK